MIGRLVARLRGMVGRVVIHMVNDAAKMQGVQITLLADQAADDVERFQQYGYTSVPFPGAEGIAVAVGGSTAHTVVISVDDRRFRLRGLAAGEVAIYDDLGHKVHLTRNGIVVDGAGHAVTMTNLTKLRVEAGIEATGGIKDLCDTADGRTMAQMRAWSAGHTHPNGNPNTGTPNQSV